MYDASSRRYGGTPRGRPRRRRPQGIHSRPDRVALWAVFMAVIALVAAAASARASESGGLGDPATTEARCADARFGQRTLSRGDCGSDVKTLNWILSADRDAGSAPLGRSFAGATEGAVERFQKRNGLRADGVVDRGTRRTLVGGMKRSLATWYGPGFFGRETACGQRLTRRTVGVAHRRLPCGTPLTIRYRGRYVRTKVIDRGPYAHGADWDLTARTAKKIGFKTTDHIRVAAVR